MRIFPTSIAALMAAAGLVMGATGASASSAQDWMAGEAGAGPAKLIYGVYTSGDQPLFQQAQFRWSGRNYCWYDLAWHGPGYYWCGYSRRRGYGRRGYGWGGPEGWNGWTGGHSGGLRRSGHVGSAHVRGGRSLGGRIGSGRPGGSYGGGSHPGHGGHMGGGHAGGGHIGESHHH